MSSDDPGSDLKPEQPREGTAGWEDPYEEMTSWLQNEAERLFTQGHYAGAEQKVRQLLDLQSQVVGRQHADFALGLSMLGELRYLQGDRASAEDLFRQSLAIRGAVLGRSHPDYAVSLTCLAGMLWRRDALEDAERCLREALAIRDQALGPDHPESIQGRKELVRILRHRGDWAGAQAMLRPIFDQADYPSGLAVGRDLSEDLLALSHHFKTLGATLGSAAHSLQSVGAPPPLEWVRALNQCRERFAALQVETVARIDALRVPNPPAITLGTLQDLAAVLDDLADAELHQLERELLRTQALTVLDRVLALSYGNNAPFPPLRECQEQARQVRQAIESGHWLDLPSRTETLAEGTDPLVDFLTIVEDRETLSDGDWATLYDSVRASFGRPLAVAAARVKLISNDEPPHRTAPHERSQVVAVARPLPAALAPNPQANPHATLVLDLAVASLVPSMGTVIHLPTASPTEPQAHRLLRNGRAPNIVEQAQTPADRNVSAIPPKPGALVGADGSDRRLAAAYRADPTIIAGPLPLLHTFGPTLEPGARAGLFVTNPIGSGGGRGEALAKLPTS